MAEARAGLDSAVCGVLADSIQLLPAADSGRVRTRVEERRADAVEKRVHEACVSCMMELAADLQQLFSKVPASVDARCDSADPRQRTQPTASFSDRQQLEKQQQHPEQAVE